ncbi:hypothetical protein P8C59_008314 [Phyllachora maydis]|uniref:tRNA dimethylallyltransferase n=1 Tax=Phyllachora maydis TaxID=1825666 RepID=A0AAD9IBY7_9PEZI|nr:hypothetical protein P8C59_008314 [Phyllachora maydis]
MEGVHAGLVNPLIVICGSTGTGKSDLAVELAMRHNGEIINADAMQMYEGLPIMTNKISQEQQRGVPHHLLGTIPLDEKPWTMAQFKPAVLKLQDEIRSRGRLPIVVGGSHYYINSLLFKDFGILDDVADSEPVGSFDQARYEEKFPILKASAEEMVAKLREVDPDVSLRWHPNDVRKIQKSLRIYLTTGKRPSDLFAEQQARKAEIGITRTKSATRNYVRGQIRWIAGKMLPGIKAYGALDKLFLLKVE